MTTTTAETYGLGLPDAWDRFPMETEAFEAAVAELRERMTEAGGDAADFRRLELMQRQLRDQLLTGSVRFCATMAGTSAPIDADEETAEKYPIVLASAAISKLTREQIGAPGPVDPEILLRGLASTTEDGVRDVQPPTLVDLPAGRALRLVRRHRAILATGEPIEFHLQSWLVPHDGGESICSLNLVTPTMAYADVLSELFDAIAATLRIFAPGEPTVMEAAGPAPEPDDPGAP